MKPKIALVVSHPIQHFCPQYASLARAQNWDFKAFFVSRLGVDAYHDKQFGKTVKWSNLYLDEFEHEFVYDKAFPVEAETETPGLLESIQAYAPDVVITYGYKHHFQRRVKKWAKATNAKVYYISDSEFNHRENPIKKIAKWLLWKSYFGGVDRFLTVGSANEAYYQYFGVGSGKMTRMNFSIDIAQYDKAFSQRAELRRAVRNKYEIADSDKVGVMVGKLIPKKNQMQLVRLVEHIEQSEDFDFKIICVGSGDDLEVLKEASRSLKKSQVIFTGFVPPEELPGYYAASDLYLHTAFYEPHSLAISEAIYMGLPLVISDTCGSHGVDDDLTYNKNGYVYKQHSTGELVDKVKAIVLDEERARSFGEFSRNYARKAQELAHGEFLMNALRADQLLEN